MLSLPFRFLCRPIRLRSGPHRMLSGPHRMLSGLHRMLSGPHRMLSGLHRMVFGPYRMLSRPNRMRSGPHRMLPGPHRMDTPRKTQHSLHHMLLTRARTRALHTHTHGSADGPRCDTRAARTRCTMQPTHANTRRERARSATNYPCRPANRRAHRVCSIMKA